MPPAASDPTRIRNARRRILAFYDREKRDLPWRRTRDPYAIWVSEVMLQQTRVDTVRERWTRFLERFPDVASLAGAGEDEVLKEWEGLGYYRRARNLRRAAKVVVEEHDGRLPTDAPRLRDLPGFGAYTSAAVASIAFGAREAVLDGNVERVLARWLDEGGNPRRQPARGRLHRSAAALLSPSRPGDFNQAMMELGATVCTPKGPRCSACPLRSSCRGRERGRAEQLPKLPRRPPIPHYDIAAGLVWRGDRLLIGKRPSEGLLGGLWEFPGGKRQEGETLEEACVREIHEETGLRARVRGPFLEVRHAYTHFRITLHLFHCEAKRGRPQPLGCETPRFVAIGELDDYAFPRANRRALEALARGEGGPRT